MHLGIDIAGALRPELEKAITARNKDFDSG